MAEENAHSVPAAAMFGARGTLIGTCRGIALPAVDFDKTGWAYSGKILSITSGKWRCSRV